MTKACLSIVGLTICLLLCGCLSSEQPSGKEAGDAQVAKPPQAGDTKVAKLPQAGDTQVAKLPQAGDTQVAKLPQAGDTQVAKPRQAGATKTVDLGGGVKLELVWCPPGTFTMGSLMAERRVTLTKGFWVGKYEVTQRQWQAVMGKNPSRSKNAVPDAPVDSVSWDDCQTFLKKLNARLAGKLPEECTYRLPTEAEWEYAARGGALSKGFTYSGSDNAGEVAWYDDNSDGKTHPVGEKKPNELGLFDMSGNVWEWCQDWYGDYLLGAVTDPTGPRTGQFRVCRGGGWNFIARFCRSAYCFSCTPAYSYYFLGLRVALAPIR